LFNAIRTISKLYQDQKRKEKEDDERKKKEAEVR
jgi:hypothetical protein